MLSLNRLTSLLDGPCRVYQDGRSFQIMWAASSCPARELNSFAMSTALIITDSPEAAEAMVRNDSARELSLMAGMGVPLTMFDAVEDLLDVAGEAAYDAGWFDTWWREDVIDEVSHALTSAMHLQLLRPRFGMARLEVSEEKLDTKPREQLVQLQQEEQALAHELQMLEDKDRGAAAGGGGGMTLYIAACVDCAVFMTLIGFPCSAPPVLVTLAAYVGPRMRRLVQGFVRNIILPRRMAQLESSGTSSGSFLSCTLTGLLEECRAVLPPARPPPTAEDLLRRQRMLEHLDALADITVSEIRRRVAVMKVAEAAPTAAADQEDDTGSGVADVLVGDVNAVAAVAAEAVG